MLFVDFFVSCLRDGCDLVVRLNTRVYCVPRLADWLPRLSQIEDAMFLDVGPSVLRYSEEAVTDMRSLLSQGPALPSSSCFLALKGTNMLDLLPLALLKCMKRSYY